MRISGVESVVDFIATFLNLNCGSSQAIRRILVDIPTRRAEQGSTEPANLKHHLLGLLPYWRDCRTLRLRLCVHQAAPIQSHPPGQGPGRYFAETSDELLEVSPSIVSRTGTLNLFDHRRQAATTVRLGEKACQRSRSWNRLFRNPSQGQDLALAIAARFLFTATDLLVNNVDNQHLIQVQRASA
jgi:hypothetical protein